MKLSRFLISVQDANNRILVASTLTKAVARFNANCWADLQRGVPELSNELTFQQWGQCSRLGFIVDDSCDEIESTIEKLNRERLSTSTLSVYLSLTTTCNFSCVYCYEKDQVTNQQINNSVVDGVIAWIENKLSSGSYSTCSLHLYGGEPLLCIDKSIYITKNVNYLCVKYHVKPDINLVTNGWLADIETISKLVNAGLGCIHFTLDGPAETHDIRRPTANGACTFQTVFNNMISAAKVFHNVKIECRINIDKSNEEKIPLLLDSINSSDEKHRISIYFNNVYQTTSQINNKCSFCSNHVYSNDISHAKTLIFLYGELLSRGYKIPHFYSKGPCMTVATDACLIAPNGDLYKCLDMLGCASMVIGSIFNKDYNSLNAKFLNATAQNTCLRESDCPYVPICSGGCAMESFITSGKPFDAACHRELLEYVNRGLLQLRFGV